MSDKRHYDTDKLHQDYKQVYAMMMKVLMIGVGGALVYFFIFIVYLGGWSHSKAEPYAKGFNERYPIDYKGLKLPEFGGPEKPEPKHHGAKHDDAGHAAAPAAHSVGGAETVAVSTTAAPDSMGAAGPAIEEGSAVTEQHTEEGTH